MGFAVVMVDFHGSTATARHSRNSIVGHWGDRPLEDLQKGWAAALSRYAYLDGDRACALGGSYGGYMVAWIAGRGTSPGSAWWTTTASWTPVTWRWITDIPARFSECEIGGGS